MIIFTYYLTKLIIIAMSDNDTSIDTKQSQEILVSFWGVLMIVLLVLFVGVMYVSFKNEKNLRKKLYNFNKAPKNYVDDDSFINH